MRAAAEPVVLDYDSEDEDIVTPVDAAGGEGMIVPGELQNRNYRTSIS
jgi:hypothetical protein